MLLVPRFQLRSVRLLAAACFAGALAAGAAALARQDITVVAGASSTQVYVGEPLRFTVSVNGSQSPAEPIWPTLDGVEVRSQGGQVTSQSMTTIINGRMQETRFEGYVFHYVLTFPRQGVYTIPPLTVAVDGRDYRTNPVSVRVREPQERGEVRARIEVDNSTPWVGEAIELRFILYLRTAIQRPSARLGSLEGRFEILDAPDDPFRSGQRTTIDFLGSATPLERGQGTLDGVQYDTFTLRKWLVPLAPGEQRLGPGSLSGEVVVRRARSVFENDQVERITVPTNEIRLDVRPLPESGRPAHYSGLVGQYRITVSASPTDVNVGDPITLTVRITSTGGVLRDPRLDLAKQPGLAGRFRISESRREPRRERDAIVIEETIRPLSEDVREVPPIEAPYFDTRTGEYAIARSNPIALNVRPTRIVTAGDAEGTTASSAIEDAAGGIAHNYGAAAALADQRFDLAAALHSPAWLMALGAPPAAYVLTLLTLTWRRRSAEKQPSRRRKRALHEAMRLLGASNEALGGADRAGLAVRHYLADRFGRSAASLTAADCVEIVAPIDAALGEQLAALLERCDAGRYGGVRGGAADELVERAASLLAAIEEAAAAVETKA